MSDSLHISLGNSAAERKAALLKLAEDLSYARRRGEGWSISQLIMAIADGCIENNFNFTIAMHSALLGDGYDGETR